MFEKYKWEVIIVNHEQDLNKWYIEDYKTKERYYCKNKNHAVKYAKSFAGCKQIVVYEKEYYTIQKRYFRSGNGWKA